MFNKTLSLEVPKMKLVEFANIAASLLAVSSESALLTNLAIFSSPGISPGRAIVLPPASAFALALPAASALSKC